jgi:hypothetical protein
MYVVSLMRAFSLDVFCHVDLPQLESLFPHGRGISGGGVGRFTADPLRTVRAVRDMFAGLTHLHSQNPLISHGDSTSTCVRRCWLFVLVGGGCSHKLMRIVACSCGECDVLLWCWQWRCAT